MDNQYVQRQPIVKRQLRAALLSGADLINGCHMATIADRAWYALHCLPRGAGGKTPAVTSLEDENKLSRGVLSRLFSGQRTKLQAVTRDKVAAALQVDARWLEYGEGDPPILSGELAPRPGAEDIPAWRPEPAQTFPARAMRTIELDEAIYSSLQDMIDLMGERGDPAIFKVLKRRRFAEGDRGSAYWEDEYKDLKQRKARQLALEDDAELTSARPVETDADDHVPEVRVKKTPTKRKS